MSIHAKFIAVVDVAKNNFVPGFYITHSVKPEYIEKIKCNKCRRHLRKYGIPRCEFTIYKDCLKVIGINIDDIIDRNSKIIYWERGFDITDKYYLHDVKHFSNICVSNMDKTKIVKQLISGRNTTPEIINSLIMNYSEILKKHKDDIKHILEKVNIPIKEIINEVFYNLLKISKFDNVKFVTWIYDNPAMYKKIFSITKMELSDINKTVMEINRNFDPLTCGVSEKQRKTTFGDTIKLIWETEIENMDFDIHAFFSKPKDKPTDPEEEYKEGEFQPYHIYYRNKSDGKIPIILDLDDLGQGQGNHTEIISFDPDKLIKMGITEITIKVQLYSGNVSTKFQVHTNINNKNIIYNGTWNTGDPKQNGFVFEKTIKLQPSVKNKLQELPDGINITNVIDNTDEIIEVQFGSKLFCAVNTDPSYGFKDHITMLPIPSMQLTDTIKGKPIIIGDKKYLYWKKLCDEIPIIFKPEHFQWDMVDKNLTTNVFSPFKKNPGIMSLLSKIWTEIPNVIKDIIELFLRNNATISVYTKQ